MSSDSEFRTRTHFFFITCPLVTPLLTGNMSHMVTYHSPCSNWSVSWWPLWSESPLGSRWWRCYRIWTQPRLSWIEWEREKKGHGIKSDCIYWEGKKADRRDFFSSPKFSWERKLAGSASLVWRCPPSSPPRLVNRTEKAASMEGPLPRVKNRC